MNRVVKYIDLNRPLLVKDFYLQPFSIEMVGIKNEEQQLFNFEVLTNKTVRFEDTLISFENDYYTIEKERAYVLLKPKTISDFIDDMVRFGLNVEWNDKVRLKIDLKLLMSKSEIENYYVNLLNKINKSHEIEIR